MRVWLDPDKMASLDLTVEDVLDSIRAQNIQVAGGTLNQSPVPSQHAFELSVQTQGRLVDVAEFENVIVKSGNNGALVKLKDVARIELAARDYATRGYLGKTPSVGVLLTMLPGANALKTAERTLSAMDEMAKDFPHDFEYKVVYNPTNYIAESIKEVFITLLLAVFMCCACYSCVLAKLAHGNYSCCGYSNLFNWDIRIDARVWIFT